MENLKTLGKKSAELIYNLYNQKKTVFTIRDVSRITGLNYNSAGRFISELKKRNIISSLKKGKHIVIPPELGNPNKYIGNPYVAAREIMNSPHYYIGFYSAMKFRGMTTQPVIKMFVVTPKRQFPPQANNDKFLFIHTDKQNIWGIRAEWATKTDKVRISDTERTIIDGLAHPEYCGGITEVAKGIWLIKEKIDFSLLLGYLRKYDKNVIAKRLGYILEILGIAGNGFVNTIKEFIKNRYDIFDPTIERKIIDKNNWRLIDNVGREQILRIISH